MSTLNHTIQLPSKPQYRGTESLWFSNYKADENKV